MDHKASLFRHPATEEHVDPVGFVEGEFRVRVTCEGTCSWRVLSQIVRGGVIAGQHARVHPYMGYLSRRSQHRMCACVCVSLPCVCFVIFRHVLY